MNDAVSETLKNTVSNGSGANYDPITELPPKLRDKHDESIRDDILQEARKIVMGNREAAYGSPEDCFSAIARLWEAYLNSRGTIIESLDITPTDVAVMMILMKVGRIANGKPKLDNWVDIAGYAACGGEIQLD